MSNIINLPTFIYPKYSDIYFKQKKQIEADTKDKLKQLSLFQPFYERNINILNKFTFDRPVDLRTGTNWMKWEIKLLSTDSLSMLRPLVEAILAGFPPDESRSSEPALVPWDTRATWYLTQWMNKSYTSRVSISIDACFGEDGLADIKLKKVPRVTTTTEYAYTPVDPWWKE